MDLISFKGNLSSIRLELSKYPWDCDEPYVIITKFQFTKILMMCIDDKISFDDLEKWTNAIECRDDIDFEDEVIKDIIFEFSSPEINGELTQARLQKVVNDLSD